MRNRILNRSSIGGPRPLRSRRSTHRIRAAHLLRAHERRTRRRYSIGKKSSCSTNFWNGESATRMCRKEPTLTPVLKPSTGPRRRFWVSRHAPSSTTTSCVQASPLFDAGKFKTVPSTSPTNLADLMRRGGRRRKTSRCRRNRAAVPLAAAFFLRNACEGRESRSDTTLLRQVRARTDTSAPSRPTSQ
jgi:hypothetical protein